LADLFRYAIPFTHSTAFAVGCSELSRRQEFKTPIALAKGHIPANEKATKTHRVIGHRGMADDR
jgi:hypothetical protein